MFLRVLGASLVILAIAIVAPALFVEQEPPRNLPWQIEKTDGSIRVFEVTLAETTVAQAERRWGEPAEVSLFRTPEDKLGVEAYFNAVNLGGLGAKLVATVDFGREALQGMFERGIRVSTLGSGTRKVTLAPDDLERVKNSPVASLTYLPRISLSEEQVRKRFGEPARRVPDPATGAEHWLYPALGLDIALSAEADEVLQYVPPARFGTVETPLLEPSE